MDRISIAKTLLKYIGRETIENDWAIAQGILVILDGVKVQEAVPETKPAPPMDDEVRPKRARSASGSKKKPFDTGKLGALRKAGWSVSKIADEMGVSDATVYKYMKQEGIA